MAELRLGPIQAALAGLREAGSSVETVNHYVRAIKGFAKWLAEEHRTAEHRLTKLATTNPETDRRVERRALTATELDRLAAAAERGPDRAGLGGYRRALLYRLAAATGFRLSELRSLTRGSSDLDATPPSVVVKAAYSKRRREDRQPLSQSLASDLSRWLNERCEGESLFPISLTHAAATLRADLAAAREAWLSEVPNAA